MPELRKRWYAFLKYSFVCIYFIMLIEELESKIVDSLGMEMK